MLSTHISSQIYTNFKYAPTLGQKKLIERFSEFLTSGSIEDILIVNGYAGTGKTSVIAAFVRTLNTLKIPVILLAPTGRAAKVAATSAGSGAFTIHKKIYRQKSLSSEYSKFDLDINRSKNAIFIVDEASMLSNSGQDSNIFGSGSLLEDLIRYVRSGVDCRLVIVGDSAQLPPIGSEYSPALDAGAMSVYGDPSVVTLDEVMRQNEESGIFFNATLVRCMIEENIIDTPLFRLSFPDIKSISGGEFLEEVEDAYCRYGMENTIVITRSNKRANKFNEGVRRHILSREEEITSGDMLMVVKNNYHFVGKDKENGIDFIANGDIAELVRIRRFEEQFGFRFADALLRFPDHNGLELECKILIDTLQSDSPSLTSEQSKQLFYAVEADYSHIKAKRKRYDAIREDPYFNAIQVKFAYSVTCHKAQGGQWGCVFIDKMLFGDELITKDLLRWLYTAITRATDRLYFVNFDDRFFEAAPTATQK